MRLFYQLSEHEQNEGISHFVDTILHDIIAHEGKLTIDETNDDQNLQAQIDQILEEMKKLETDEKKVDFLLENKTTSDVIFGIATDLARDSLYIDDEVVVFTGDFAPEEETEEVASNNKPHSVN